MLSIINQTASLIKKFFSYILKRINDLIFFLILLPAISATLIKFYRSLPKWLHSPISKWLAKLKKAENFCVFDINGLRVHFHKLGLYDNRGYGAISRYIYKELGKLQDKKKVFREIYFIISPHFCSAKLAPKSVVMVHDLSPLYLKDMFNKLPHTYDLFNTTFREIIPETKHIIAISNDTKKKICESYDIKPEKVSTVLNAVWDGKPKNTVIEKDVVKKDYFIIVGAFDLHKNIEVIFEVWDRYSSISKNYDLKVIGSKRKKGFYKNLNESIHILGYVPQDELDTLIAGAKALLLPSLLEGFGLPPFEAALHNVPSICSNRPAMNELLANAAIFVEPSDHCQWKNAIIDIATNKDLAKNTAEKIKQIALPLTSKNQVSKLLVVLNKYASPL